MTIRQLSETVINQIAAGEVVERPASVIKELVENALDAGATRIEVVTSGGGANLMRVSDNGCGMSADELPMAISRHCTSKLSDDIFDIRSLGFRGEALPSIGSVSKLLIRSRPIGGDSGAEISVTGGKIEGPKPAGGNQGTLVEVRDLFFATPARLKFMKTARAESSAISDMIKRISLAFPNVHFTLVSEERQALDYPSCGDNENSALKRITQVLGREFKDNSLSLDAMREGVGLTGFISLPAYNRGNAMHQYSYVNGRPVRDKMLAGALRAAYSDTLPRDRHCLAALFITIDPTLVDVNVHPAKADVRFRDGGLVRGLIIGAIRQALGTSGIRASTGAADAMMQAFQNNMPATNGQGTNHNQWQNTRPSAPYDYAASPFRPANGEQRSENLSFRPPTYQTQNHFGENPQTQFSGVDYQSADARAFDEVSDDGPTTARPLGAARAQVHENYIIAQTQNSLVIVDQHAAHERLVYEALKQALDSKPIAAQLLLIPEIVDLGTDDAERIARHSETLAHFGLGVERFGPGAIAVRETPAMLGEIEAGQLLRDLADEIAEQDTADTLKERIHAIASRMACHGSVRSGRRMRGEEMNALLRQMEATPGSGTCNHGRPTYIELQLSDIEKLFARR